MIKDNHEVNHPPDTCQRGRISIQYRHDRGVNIIYPSLTFLFFEP
ncbi:uncharacterized protein METZ01_LOCUS122353 [marine metagenome]|uniref:Uncharacterized protein n=1 Tax=marine metagenome TaxID=408172 RepID=A0A381XXJ9_9ZZZZ